MRLFRYSVRIEGYMTVNMWNAETSSCYKNSAATSDGAVFSIVWGVVKTKCVLTSETTCKLEKTNKNTSNDSCSDNNNTSENINKDINNNNNNNNINNNTSNIDEGDWNNKQTKCTIATKQ